MNEFYKSNLMFFIIFILLFWYEVIIYKISTLCIS